MNAVAITDGTAAHVSAPPAPRIEFVDTLRGFALFGVFAANLLIFSGIVYMTADQQATLFTSPLDSTLAWLERFFIENKFMGLFSMLFGVSFWLFLQRARAPGTSPTFLFYRRIFWLFVIGSVHGWLLWCFDILRFYALWAILLPVFVRTRPRRLLATALAASLLVPAVVAAVDASIARPAGSSSGMDAMAVAAFSAGTYGEVLRANWRYDWYLTLSISQIGYQVAVFGHLLLGLYIARTLDLAHLAKHRQLLRRALLLCGVAGAAGSAVFAADLLSDVSGSTVPCIRKLVVETGNLGLSLTYASGLALLFLRGGRIQTIISILAPVGRLALTCYLLQTAFGIWMFYGFARGPAAMGRVPPSLLIVVLVGGFFVQIVGAHAWVSRFRFGPAEWVWRGLTYAKLPPLRVR